jgi:hypothetical protein
MSEREKLLKFLDENQPYYQSIEMYLYTIMGLLEDEDTIIDSDEIGQVEEFGNFLLEVSERLKKV